jgi:hypothetical protein
MRFRLVKLLVRVIRLEVLFMRFLGRGRCLGIFLFFFNWRCFFFGFLVRFVEADTTY